jgi:hypothetical protein
MMATRVMKRFSTLFMERMNEIASYVGFVCGANVKKGEATYPSVCIVLGWFFDYSGAVLR